MLIASSVATFHSHITSPTGWSHPSGDALQATQVATTILHSTPMHLGAPQTVCAVLGGTTKASQAALHSYDLKAGGRDVDWMEALRTTCNTTLVLRPADSMYEFAVDGVLDATTLCFGDKVRSPR